MKSIVKIVVTAIVVAGVAMMVPNVAGAESNKATVLVAGPAAPVTPIPVTIVGPVQVRVEEPTIPSWKNRVSFGPLGLLFGFGTFTYERGLGQHFSVEASPSYIYWGFDDAKLYGAGLGIGGSYYISGDAPRGLRVTASVTPSFITSDSKSASSETAFLFQGKALMGYNWVWRSQFTLGLGGGIQYLTVSNKNLKTSFHGLLPAIDFNLGFVF